jgi:hypothetical protein
MKKLLFLAIFLILAIPASGERWRIDYVTILRPTPKGMETTLEGEIDAIATYKDNRLSISGWKKEFSYSRIGDFSLIYMGGYKADMAAFIDHEDGHEMAVLFVFAPEEEEEEEEGIVLYYDYDGGDSMTIILRAWKLED